MTNQAGSDFLGKERIFKLMLKFCIPCVLSLLVSALYNIVDQIFIGNSELSTLGNAATGVVFPIFVIAQAFAWWIGDGCAAYLNIHQGRNDLGNAHRCIGSGITVTLIMSLILLAVFYPVKTQFLTLFGASENSIDYAVQYFNIILGFFPVYMLSNMINSVLRADGSPMKSMASMLLGAIINIILDPIFIFVCHWGMAGAAWATVIGQVASCAVSVGCLFFTKTFRLKLKSFIPRFKILAEAVKLGISSFITQMTIVAVSLICNIMLAKYGSQSSYGADIPIAIIGIESKVFTVVISIVVGIVLGCQPIIGYNIGANNWHRVKRLYLLIFTSTVAVGLIATILFEAAPDAIMGIFGKPTNIPNPDDYWDFGEKTFRIFLMFVTFTCLIKMSSIFFQAVGKPIYSVITSLVRDIVCFIPLICILPLFFGIEGILYAAPASDILAGLVTAVFTLIYFKKMPKNSENEVSAPAEETAEQTEIPEHN